MNVQHEETERRCERTWVEVELHGKAIKCVRMQVEAVDAAV